MQYNDIYKQKQWSTGKSQKENKSYTETLRENLRKNRCGRKKVWSPNAGNVRESEVNGGENVSQKTAKVKIMFALLSLNNRKRTYCLLIVFHPDIKICVHFYGAWDNNNHLPLKISTYSKTYSKFCHLEELFEGFYAIFICLLLF